MGFALYDVNGYLGDVATARGLGDLYKAVTDPAVNEFFDNGHSTRLSEVMSGLTEVGRGEGDVAETARGLIDLIRKAEEVIILSDGLLDT